MDIFKTMDVVSSGLTVERARLNAIASNVANANSVKGVNGGPYKRKDVVLESVPMEPDFEGSLQDAQNLTHVEAKVADVVEDQNPPRLVYDPNHPEADANGYVAFPNVNPVEEMANMISADRAYQANVSVFQTTKQMALKALEIGR